ncbi:MAG: hypothetical protein Nkreftii_000052 [Candidatus Nitrospira kreftii]|uniref:Peptidase S8/S53 domain-containing protein n=1 Tax=Candidatus Nitrospira kreftii TaxID=2652173 RepID=A0A7S8FAF6_9BACT|nr:MAG: hypothetical protein Nkreftii_000052 [Candidatus Nitrospira kreftii]
MKSLLFKLDVEFINARIACRLDSSATTSVSVLTYVLLVACRAGSTSLYTLRQSIFLSIFVYGFVFSLANPIEAFAICIDDNRTKVSLEQASRIITHATHPSATQEDTTQFLKILPCYGNLYIVEGDLLLKESQVEDYLNQVRSRKARSERKALRRSPGELVVASRDGKPSYLKTPGERKLTFSIDLKSFVDNAARLDEEQTSAPVEDSTLNSIASNLCAEKPDSLSKSISWARDYFVVVEHFCKASRQWQDLCKECGISFTYVPKLNTAPSREKGTFVVRRYKGSTVPSFIVLAFFPEEEGRRYVDVSNSFFNTAHDQTGLFRHELGHILGYLHEEVNKTQGCIELDGNWIELTPYNPNSVMHSFCAGKARMDFKFQESDKVGHKLLYGNSIPPPQKKGMPHTHANHFECDLNTGASPTILRDTTCKVYYRSKRGHHRGPIDHYMIAASVPQFRHTLLTASREVGVAHPQNTQLVQHRSGANRTSKTLSPSAEESRPNLRRSQRRLVDPRSFFEACNKKQKLPLEVGDYALLTFHQNERWFGTKRTTSASNRVVNVHIFDVPLQYHRDIERAVQEVIETPGTDSWSNIQAEALASLNPNQTRLLCKEDEERTFDQRAHSTHMAGIIASQIRLIGLSPTSRIASYKLSEYDKEPPPDHFFHELDLFNSDGRKHLVLLAAKLIPSTSQPHADKSPEELNPLANAFTRHNVLVVAANAHNQNGDDFVLLDPYDPKNLPSNLGLLDNVIVVTACVNCKDLKRASLLPSMYIARQDHLIHLAAPGDRIPGLTYLDDYSVAGGSSQAAAYVAGVAALMMTHYPDFYTRPDLVKSRLITSASPHLLTPINISGGIVDPSLATLRPDASWLKVKGDAEYRQIDIHSWCTPLIKLVDQVRLDSQEGINQSTADILRIKRGPKTDSGKSTWFVWRKVREVNQKQFRSAIIRGRPMLVSLGSNGSPYNRKFVEVELENEKRELALEQIDDIFVKGTNGIGNVSSSCSTG